MLLKTAGLTGGECLTYENIRRMSRPHNVLEAGKIGSKTFTYAELSEVYKDIAELSDTGRVFIHPQDLASGSGYQPDFY